MKVLKKTTIHFESVDITTAIRMYLLDKGYKVNNIQFNIEEFTDGDSAAKLVGAEIDVDETNP